MKRLPVGVALLSALAFSWTLALAGQEEEKSPLQNEVRSRMKDLFLALQSGDASKVASLWTTSGEYIRDDLVIQGRESIQKAYAEHFKAKRQGGMPRLVSDSVRLLSDNLAVFDASIVVEHANPVDNVRVHVQTTLVKANGTWLIGMLRETVAGPSVEDFAWMVGTWNFKAGDAQGIMEVRFTEEKTFLIIRTKTKKDDVQMTGVQVLGVNPATGGIKSWSFESDGSVGSAQWVQTDKSWLSKITSTSAGGESITAIATISPKSKDEFTYQLSEHAINGVATPDAEAIVVKRVAATASTK